MGGHEDKSRSIGRIRRLHFHQRQQRNGEYFGIRALRPGGHGSDHVGYSGGRYDIQNIQNHMPS
jgi:hypothetical protein